MELLLPWVINIQPSGYVVGLIGCWACSEASCCGENSLELNPAWSLCIVSSFLCSLRGGGRRFSHAPTHTLYVCLCTRLCVYVRAYCSLCVCCFSSLGRFVSFSFIMMNVSELGWTLDLCAAPWLVSNLFLLTWAGLYSSSSSNAECQCNLSLKESRACSPPVCQELYLWSREQSLSCQGQPRGI